MPNNSQEEGDQGMEQFVETTITPQEINVNDVLNTEAAQMDTGDNDCEGCISTYPIKNLNLKK